MLIASVGGGDENPELARLRINAGERDPAGGGCFG